MRLASKPGRPKSAAFFDEPFDALQSVRPKRCALGRLLGAAGGACAPLLMTDPSDLIARALEILAEEDEAWRVRRGLDLTPRSVR